MYVCLIGIQQSGHLLIMLRTCSILSSGEWKLSTTSGCVVSLSSSREGHVRGLIANTAVWDHSICYLALKVYDFTKWQTEK